jgi:hypothetical protein
MLSWAESVPSLRLGRFNRGLAQSSIHSGRYSIKLVLVV